MNVFWEDYTNVITELVAPVLEIYEYIMDTKSDPRTQNWLLITSPIPLLLIIATYLYFCVWLGPRLMKERKAYELKYIVSMYDVLQIILNVYIVCEHIKGGWGVGYSFACQPVDYSDSPRAVKMAAAVWWYFMCNMIALLDTIFFILRKKNNQMSFLHLYHHSMMPLCSWVGVKYFPGGHGTLLGLINSFTHILMYSYYLVTNLNPNFQKYVKWKRHLTELQMVQFCILILHNAQVLLRRCDYPKIAAIVLGFHAFLFLIMSMLNFRNDQ